MSTVVVYDPRFLDWSRWASLQVSSHLQYGPGEIPQPYPEERWKDWAQAYISAPGHAALLLPMPQFFKDWRSWALAINHVFALAGP